MKIPIYFFSLLLTLNVYAQSSSPKSTLLKYKVKYGTNKKVDDLSKKLVAVPYLKDGGYFISNYDGKILSNQKFDQITVFPKLPYVVGIIDEVHYVYSINGNKLVEEGFEKITVNNFRMSSGSKVPNLLVVNEEKDTFQLEVDNFNLFEESRAILKQQREDRRENRPDTRELIKNLRENGIKDKSGKELSPHNINVRESYYANWISVHNYKLYGLLDLQGNWIYPLEERRMTLYNVCCVPRNWDGIKILEGNCSFVLNQEYELVTQSPQCGLIQFDDLELSAIPEDIKPDLDKTRMGILIQDFVSITDRNWTHLFTPKGKYIQSFKGGSGGIPKNADVWKLSFRSDKNRGKQISYYVRLADGFIYADDLSSY